MKILVGVDDPKSSEATLQALVAQIGPHEKKEVRVLHVVAPPSSSTPPEMAAGYAPELQEQMEEAREIVEQAAKILRNAGFKVDTAVRKGDIREVIIDSAAEWHADLMVLGSHGRKGLQRFLLGSVAESVARHAPCSVEIVRVSANR
jgi:nucleotide-binding universal stress UspA family protein